MNYQEYAEKLLDYLPALRSRENSRNQRGVTAGELSALLYLAKEHDGATAGELTTAIRVRSSRTTAILQALEHKGLLQREADPDDGRRVLAYLTPEGRDLEKKLRVSAIGRIVALLEYLGEDDSRETLRIIERVLDYEKTKK